MSIKKVTENGDIYWQNAAGLYHRTNGPAVECSNVFKTWWVNGKRHREDGPAVEWENGYKEYWLNDVQYTEEEYKDEILKDLTWGFDIIPEKEKDEYYEQCVKEQKQINDMYNPNKSDGGPSTYYDVFPQDVKTANDIIEHLSVNIWKEYSCHMKDVFKAITRWGSKEGTSVEYDARKLIYSGVRMLRMMIGNQKTREYLQNLLDDKQFK